MKQKAIYALIIASIIAGFNGIMIKAMESMTAGSIAFIRATIPSILLLAWIFQTKTNIFRGNTKKMLGASFINAGRIYLYLMAFIYTTIGNAIILFYSWPIFVSLLGIFFLKEKVSRKQILLLLTAFTGLIIAYSGKSFSFEDKDFVGMLAAIFASIGYAITVVIFKSESDNYHRNEIIFFQNLAGIFVFLPFFFSNYPVAELSDIGVAFLYALLIGIGVYSLFFYGLKHLKASTASSMMYLEVVSALIVSALILNESLSVNMVVGGSLILLSSFLVTNLNKN